MAFVEFSESTIDRYRDGYRDGDLYTIPDALELLRRLEAQDTRRITGDISGGAASKLLADLGLSNEAAPQSLSDLVSGTTSSPVGLGAAVLLLAAGLARQPGLVSKVASKLKVGGKAAGRAARTAGTSMGTRARSLATGLGKAAKTVAKNPGPTATWLGLGTAAAAYAPRLLGLGPYSEQAQMERQIQMLQEEQKVRWGPDSPEAKFLQEQMKREDARYERQLQENRLNWALQAAEQEHQQRYNAIAGFLERYNNIRRNELQTMAQLMGLTM